MTTAIHTSTAPQQSFDSFYRAVDGESIHAEKRNQSTEIKYYSEKIYGTYSDFIASDDFVLLQVEYTADLEKLEALAQQHISLKPADIAKIFQEFKDHLFREYSKETQIYGLLADTYRAIAYGEVRLNLHLALKGIEENKSLTKENIAQALNEMVDGLNQCIGRVQSNMVGAIQIVREDHKNFHEYICVIQRKLAGQIANEFVQYKHKNGHEKFGNVYHIHIINYLLNTVSEQFAFEKSTEYGLRYTKGREVTAAVVEEFKLYIESKLTNKALFEYLVQDFIQKFSHIYIKCDGPYTANGYYDQAGIKGDCRESLYDSASTLLTELRVVTGNKDFGFTDLFESDVIGEPVSPRRVQFNLKRALATELHEKLKGANTLSFYLTSDSTKSIKVISGDCFSWLDIDGEPNLATIEHLPLIHKVKCTDEIKSELIVQSLADEKKTPVQLYHWLEVQLICSSIQSHAQLMSQVKKDLIDNAAEIVMLIKNESSCNRLKIVSAIAGENELIMMAIIERKLTLNDDLSDEELTALQTQMETVNFNTPELDGIKIAIRQLPSNSADNLLKIAITQQKPEFLQGLLECTSSMSGHCQNSRKLRTRPGRLLHLAYRLESKPCFELLVNRPDVDINFIDSDSSSDLCLLHQAIDNKNDFYAKLLLSKAEVDLWQMNGKNQTVLTRIQDHETFKAIADKTLADRFASHQMQFNEHGEGFQEEPFSVCLNESHYDEISELCKTMQEDQNFDRIYSKLCRLSTDTSSDELHANIKFILGYWLKARSDTDVDLILHFLSQQSAVNLFVLQCVNKELNNLEIHKLIVKTKMENDLSLTQDDLDCFEIHYVEIRSLLGSYLWPEPTFQKILSDAIQKNNIGLTKMLLTEKPSMSFERTFSVPKKWDKVYNECTPMNYAIVNGTEEMCMLMLDFRPDEYRCEESHLNHSTLLKARFKFFSQVLSKKNISFTQRNNYNQTLLHCAIQAANQVEEVALKLEAKAVVNALACRVEVDIFAVDSSSNCCLDKLLEFIPLEKLILLITNNTCIQEPDSRTKTRKNKGLSLFKAKAVEMKYLTFSEQLNKLNQSLLAGCNDEKLINTIFELIEANDFSLSESQLKSMSLIILANRYGHIGGLDRLLSRHNILISIKNKQQIHGLINRLCITYSKFRGTLNSVTSEK
ncbi:MAG: hypothetical protein HAW66_07405 [Shewanella sp.]|nr:hypothetical protein [Shewanella sp.]